MKAPPITRKEFDELFKAVNNRGRWGEKDELGTLNYITPDKIAAAAKLIQVGRTVSLAIPINTAAGPDNPRPAVRHLIRNHDVIRPEGEPRFALDYLATEFHGDCLTHLDALCHVSYMGLLYNGKPTSLVTSEGPLAMDVTAYVRGIVGRGVLLDIPRLRGEKWLELGEAVTTDELEAAEKDEGVRLGEGDILLFRTGHHRRRLELGPWNCGYSGQGRAGLHASTALWMHERKIAAFLPDGDGETVPSNVEGVASPLHALQLAAMGMACADSLQLEDLAKTCEEERRWEFMVCAAPLCLPKGTGSLFNPIALF